MYYIIMLEANVILASDSDQCFYVIVSFDDDHAIFNAYL